MLQRYYRACQALTGSLLLCGWATSGWAQPPASQVPRAQLPRPAATVQNGGRSNPEPRAPQGGEQRPPANPLRVQTLDPKLESILQSWEQESGKITVLQGRHTRSEINSVFGVEKKSEGMFFYVAPDRGRFDMKGIPVKPGEKSTIVNPETQQPYSLASGTDQGWICTGKNILILNVESKEYEVHEIPEQMRGENIVQSPLPFLFGMKAADAKRRFSLRLVRETEAIYVIEAIPLTQMDSQNYQRALIALDRETFVPHGVQLLDPAGTLQTKYLFQDIKVNPSRNVLMSLLQFGRDRNPFQPDLSDWKRVQTADIQPASNEVPAGEGASPIRSANAVPNGFQNQNRGPARAPNPSRTQ